jgi:trehalose synthase
MYQVEVESASLAPLVTLLTESRAARLMGAAERARQLLDNRVVWNISATAHGGGVAEMLQVLVGYGCGAGVDTRWLVLDGDDRFFTITKRIHNALHGLAVTEFDEADRMHYELVLKDNLAGLVEHVRPGDIVLLHDPQTAGLSEPLRQLGARTVWRCHIGRDQASAETGWGWSFLRSYLEHVDAFVFSRRCYVPDWVPANRTWVIAPSIDVFSAKNRELADDDVARILCGAGILQGARDQAVSFIRRDGTVGTVGEHPGVMSGSPLPLSARLVVQISRWDRLKDMTGVLAGFAEHVAGVEPGVHLVLAGPDASGVSDDPEGAQVLESCRAAWQRLPDAMRQRCHLASLPMDDNDENATIVNALQRHAAVVVQKSLAEGFGLTVTEAMWKSRPVLASAVGGIQDQITDGVNGLLLPDPLDLAGFGQRLRLLLDDRALAHRCSSAAHAKVQEEYLVDRHLRQYVELLGALATSS